VLTNAELEAIVNQSKLLPKYNREIDSHSAYEILNQKLEEASYRSAESVQNKSPRQKKETSIFDTPAMRQVERTAASVITRSVLGALGLGGRSRRRW